MRFYCLTCKKNVDVPDKNVKYRTTANGRKQAMAKCPDCGRMMYKFV
jgi:RNase P subunit RPR2